MPITVETLSNTQLENLVENNRRQRATNAPLYVDALRELEKRKGKGLARISHTGGVFGGQSWRRVIERVKRAAVVR